MDPLDFVTNLAHEAAAVLMDRYHDLHEVTEKHRHDIVTEADRASEDAIVRAIRTAFPRAAILGEEGGVYPGTSDERFVVDPLDGTTNYAHRYPMFCVSIAYEVAGVVEAGAIEAPMLGLCFAARRGGGATLNGKPIGVSSAATLGSALICTGFNPSNYERNGAYFARMSHLAQGVRRDGSAALDLGFVAAGSFDGFWEWDLKPWDVAAGALIITEAGGTVTTIGGGPMHIADGSIAASNGPIHAEFCAALQAVAEG